MSLRAPSKSASFLLGSTYRKNGMELMGKSFQRLTRRRQIVVACAWTIDIHLQFYMPPLLLHSFASSVISVFPVRLGVKHRSTVPDEKQRRVGERGREGGREGERERERERE